MDRHHIEANSALVIERNRELLAMLAQFDNKPRHLSGEWHDRVQQAAHDRLAEFAVLEWEDEGARVNPLRIVVTLTVRGRALASQPPVAPPGEISLGPPLKPGPGDEPR